MQCISLGHVILWALPFTFLPAEFLDDFCGVCCPYSRHGGQYSGFLLLSACDWTGALVCFSCKNLVSYFHLFYFACSPSSFIDPWFSEVLWGHQIPSRHYTCSLVCSWRNLCQNLRASLVVSIVFVLYGQSCTSRSLPITQWIAFSFCDRSPISWTVLFSSFCSGSL